MRSKWRTLIFVPASRSARKAHSLFLQSNIFLTVYATNLLYPTSRCSFYNITVANFQIDSKSSKKYFFSNNNNNQLKLFFYGVPYIYVLKQCLDCNKLSQSFILMHYFTQNHTKFLIRHKINLKSSFFQKNNNK